MDLLLAGITAKPVRHKDRLRHGLIMLIGLSTSTGGVALVVLSLWAVPLFLICLGAQLAYLSCICPGRVPPYPWRTRTMPKAATRASMPRCTLVRLLSRCSLRPPTACYATGAMHGHWPFPLLALVLWSVMAGIFSGGRDPSPHGRLTKSMKTGPKTHQSFSRAAPDSNQPEAATASSMPIRARICSRTSTCPRTWPAAFTIGNMPSSLLRTARSGWTPSSKMRRTRPSTARRRGPPGRTLGIFGEGNVDGPIYPQRILYVGPSEQLDWRSVSKDVSARGMLMRRPAVARASMIVR